MGSEAWPQDLSRRQFLKAGLLTGLGAFVSAWWLPLRHLHAGGGSIPTRPLGRTLAQVSIIGLGGEGMLRTWDRHREAAAVIHRAIDQGITYCDTAPAYSGSQDYYGAVLQERRKGIFLASKTHERSRDGSLRLLDDSLRRLRTDHLDLWQLHDLRTTEELDEIFGQAGAIRAMEEARGDGRVRFLGLTGHYDPSVLAEAIRRYPFDTVLVALNAADRARRSFIDQVLPVAVEREVGIIGMKVVARGHLLKPGGVLTMREALGYVWSLPVSTAIVGFQAVGEVDEAVELARHVAPFSSEEMARLEALARPSAEAVSWFKRSA